MGNPAPLEVGAFPLRITRLVDLGLGARHVWQSAGEGAYHLNDAEGMFRLGFRIERLVNALSPR